MYQPLFTKLIRTKNTENLPKQNNDRYSIKRNSKHTEDTFEDIVAKKIKLDCTKDNISFGENENRDQNPLPQIIYCLLYLLSLDKAFFFLQ